MMNFTRLGLIILLLARSVLPLGASLADDLASADKSLASGNPADAVALYQAILTSPRLLKSSAPEIWFNLGLAQEKTDDPVAASLSFRRALLLDPTLQPAGKKLSEILGTLGVPVSTDFRQRMLMAVHPEVLILGGAILGWFGVFLLVVLLLTAPRRPLLIAVAITLCILGHGLSLAVSLIDPRRTAAAAAVVTAKTAPVLRNTPADNGASTGTLSPGSLITILSRNGVWWYVSDGLGHTGWIPANTVTPLLPSSAGS